MTEIQWPIDRKQPFKSFILSGIEKGTLKIFLRDMLVDYLKNSLNEEERKQALEDISSQQNERQDMEKDPTNPFHKDELSFEHYCSVKYNHLYNHIMNIIDSRVQNKIAETTEKVDITDSWYQSIQARIGTTSSIEWLDIKNPYDNVVRRRWVGSHLSGKQIFRERHISGNIRQLFSLLTTDTTFRRAIIALPEVLWCFVRELGFSDRHMLHLCMLAFISERAHQLGQKCDSIQMWGSNEFRSYIKWDEIDELQDYIETWFKEFDAEFGPK